MTVWDKQILTFYKSLVLDIKLPRGVEVMNPYRDTYAFSLCEKYYKKFYNDEGKRFLIFGINPGRFGSGMTGISFTDPVKLEKECGIANDFPKKVELSADFIYMMVHAYGGLSEFFSEFFITSVCPLGFTKDGTNINYYDDPKLQKAILPFVIKTISEMASWNVHREKCFCLGEGKNFQFLNSLNEKHQWFQEIVPLSHPRFIMQYKRKKVDEYVREYVRKFRT